MDYFKIFSLVFMVFITYKLYSNECKMIEGFEGSTQSLGGVDDTNAINTLAQIARKLMDKGLTIPGDINVQGVIQSSVGKWNTSADGKNRTHYGNNENSFYGSGNGVHNFRTGANGDGPDGVVIGPGVVTVNGVLNSAHSVWHTSTDQKHRLYYGNNSHTYYKTADSHVWRNKDDTDKMLLNHEGNLMVQGRNILGELTHLQNQVNNKVSINEIVFLKRKDNDNDENSYFVGDNMHWANKGNGWTKWRISR